MIENQDIQTVYNYINSHWQNTVRHETNDTGTLLGLPYPYTVPSQKEPTMQNNFYWDTYFTNVGLLRQGFHELAKSNVDNLLFEVEKYGFVPNGNRTFFLSRSQAPFLAMMVRDIFDYSRDLDWLKTAYEILKKEYAFWTKKRVTPIGLNRYFHHATNEEMVEFFDGELKNRPKLSPQTEEEKLILSAHLLAEAESGCDFTPRFEQRCADFAPADLNSYLYLNEVNGAYFCEVLKNDESSIWIKRAQERLSLIHRYCWNDEVGLFFDYDLINNRQNRIATLATFAPLWARLATGKQTKAIVKNLTRFEFNYGVAVCENSQQKTIFQWDYPNGWPPLFYIAIKGLDNYGFCKEAERIAEKYVQVVIKNFKETGDLWEKYNVVDGSIQVKNEYEMPAMMGWTAGVFVFCAELLGAQLS